VKRFIFGLIAGLLLLGLYYGLYYVANGAMPLPISGLGLAAMIYAAIGTLDPDDLDNASDGPIVQVGPGGDYTREVNRV